MEYAYDFLFEKVSKSFPCVISEWLPINQTYQLILAAVAKLLYDDHSRIINLPN